MTKEQEVEDMFGTDNQGRFVLANIIGWTVVGIITCGIIIL